MKNKLNLNNKNNNKELWLKLIIKAVSIDEAKT